MCVEYIPGFNNLILVAPHSFKNDGDDYEVHADEITEYLAQELGCHAYYLDPCVHFLVIFGY